MPDAKGFNPNWKLLPADELAVHLKLALTRRSVEWGETLHTDEQWSEMSGEILEGLRNDAIETPTITVRSYGPVSDREVSITVQRGGAAGTTYICEHLFDSGASETFDPTEAVEFEAGGELMQLKSGDFVSVVVEERV